MIMTWHLYRLRIISFLHRNVQLSTQCGCRRRDQSIYWIKFRYYVNCLWKNIMAQAKIYLVAVTLCLPRIHSKASNSYTNSFESNNFISIHERVLVPEFCICCVSVIPTMRKQIQMQLQLQNSMPVYWSAWVKWVKWVRCIKFISSRISRFDTVHMQFNGFLERKCV